MTWSDRVIATIAILFAAACGGLGTWAAGRPLPQKYPIDFSYGTYINYFWDSRTNLCFASLRNRNLYGDVETIANVPCTDAVRTQINAKPKRDR
jgi:hypothetical protein